MRHVDFVVEEFPEDRGDPTAPTLPPQPPLPYRVQLDAGRTARGGAGILDGRRGAASPLSWCFLDGRRKGGFDARRGLVVDARTTSGPRR